MDRLQLFFQVWPPYSWAESRSVSGLSQHRHKQDTNQHQSRLFSHFSIGYRKLVTVSFFFCSLKLECEKLVQEKTEMQRHYVMVRWMPGLAELYLDATCNVILMKTVHFYLE